MLARGMQFSFAQIMTHGPIILREKSPKDFIIVNIRVMKHKTLFQEYATG